MQVNYFCFANASGYSQAAQDLILSICDTYDVRMQYIYGNTVKRAGMSLERQRIFDSLLKKKKDPNCINIFHCIPSLQRQFANETGKRKVGFATFETFEPPDQGGGSWIKILNNNDAAICPSSFNERVFKNAGLNKPIFKIPHVCDTTLYHKNVKPLEKKDKFTFLYFADWRLRKGYKALLEAWMHEFEEKDNVELVIKTSKTAIAKTFLAKLKQDLGFFKKDTAPIVFEERTFDEESLPSFLKSNSCYISPTRGEGFGLPGLQCMFLKVPVIITNFSGCQEYANENTACLLEPAGFEYIEECLDGLPQFRGKKWPIITVKSVRKAMREMVESYDTYQNKAEFAYNYVNERFTYKNSIEEFKKLMESVS